MAMCGEQQHQFGSCLTIDSFAGRTPNAMIVGNLLTNQHRIFLQFQGLEESAILGLASTKSTILARPMG